MTFSWFIQKLYKFCGGRRSQQDFFIDFFSNVVDETDEGWELLDKKDYLNKFFTGRNLPKADARYILQNLNRDNLDDYVLNNSTSDDTLVLLCKEFEPDIENATKKDISKRIADLFLSIIENIAAKKQTTIKAKSNAPLLSVTSIEKALADIINKLSNLTEKELKSIADLQFNPIAVDRKILPKNSNLKKEIKDDVLQYFGYIQVLLSNVAKTNSAFVNSLLQTVKAASENFIAQKKTQEEVCLNMANWLKTITFAESYTACKILVSFFVQNCEVFYETA